jgi:hypothetical protein
VPVPPSGTTAGRNITVSRLGVGNYRLTFGEWPGNWVGPEGYSFEGGTPLNLAGCTVVFSTPDPTNKRVDFTVYSGGTTPAVRELAATEKLHMNLRFKTAALAL